MDCELCGAKNASRRAEVEGTTVMVCDNCVSMGKEIVQYRPIVRHSNVRMPDELSVEIDENFSKRLKSLREAKKLTQKELAEKLQVKDSFVKRMEEGWNPPLDMIKRIEKFFGVSMLGSSPESKIKPTKRDAVTLGDIVEVK